jgi:cell division septation protein DedD
MPPAAEPEPAPKPPAATPPPSAPAPRSAPPAVTSAPPAAQPPQKTTPPPPRERAKTPDKRQWRVQFAALRSRKRAETSWHALISLHAEALRGMAPIYQRVDLGPGKGVFHRLQAGPFASRTAARALCRRIVDKAPGQACLVIRPKR